MSVFPMGLQIRQKPAETLTQQGSGDFWTAQNTAGTTQPACSLFSCNIDASLDVFSVILSIMHGTDTIIPVVHD